MGLVLWIAIKVKNMEDMFAYVDDAFSWDFDGNLDLYEPYEAFIPEKQFKLLSLWDELGIPHEQSKQVQGQSLRIIGFEVDVSQMTITMPAKALQELVHATRTFAQPNKRRTLRDFQQIAGWINWGLNVFPLLRPGLCTLYEKMRGKTQSRLLLFVSLALCRELIWLADHMSQLPGVSMLASREWKHADAHVHLYADACPLGLGFWHPRSLQGFQYATTSTDEQGIFFLEALAVLSALHWYLHAHPTNKSERIRIVIYTDNENTVNMFNTLHASPNLNPILMTAIDLLIIHNAELRVFHIPGVANGIADALSRFQNDRAQRQSFGLNINPFIPPQLTKGASIS
jgi:hypothetical protein